jgi:hypothetical protein
MAVLTQECDVVKVWLCACIHILICDHVYYIIGRILLKKKTDKRAITDFVVFLDYSTKKREVKTMELVNKPLTSSSQSWSRRAARRHSPKVEYYSELRTWLQRAILEAEKNKDFDKKDQLLDLLKEL